MVSSQFLFSYTDQLVSSDLVDWVEGPLASVPAPAFHQARGFQDVLGVSSAGPRTRAGEAYKLGLLTGRLVREQGGAQEVPLGWSSVIAGKLPLTRLGNYSYIIGRALRNGITSGLESAFDHLACSQILHVGFQTNGRWYSTVAIMQFAKSEVEAGLTRRLSDVETRYLSGAVINTLDSPNRNLLLGPYRDGSKIQNILFDVEDRGEILFSPLELEQIAAVQEININDIVKRKAALFWAQPDRGIFSRASRSASFDLIDEFIAVDRWLAGRDIPNLLSPMYDIIQSSKVNKGIFRLANEQFSDFGDLSKEWERYESNLFELVNVAAEGANSDEPPPSWKNIQLSLRASGGGEHPVDDGGLTPDEGTDAIPVDEMEFAGGSAEPFDVVSYIDSFFDSVLQEPPAPTKEAPKVKSAAKVGKPNYEAKEAENRELGCAGELFVVEYERTKLRNAGKPELADKIQWVSKEIGDGLGYDIISYEPDGSPIHIEVKTTKSGKATPFIISANELTVWNEKQGSFRLYRVFSFDKSPKIFVICGDPNDQIQLEPISYRARI